MSLVIDASALVEVLTKTPLGDRVGRRIREDDLYAPAHLDAEILSALGRLHRAGVRTEAEVGLGLSAFARLPIGRQALLPLLAGAWARRYNVSLHDAPYVELAAQLGSPVITVNRRLAAASPLAELVS